MSLAASMLDDDALRVVDDGFELDVHLNWYRSLPLSSVKTVELTVNGEAIPRDEITFVVNGSVRALGVLTNHSVEKWFALDVATLLARPTLAELAPPGDV